VSNYEGEARRILDVACAHVSLPAADATVIRLGENAIFRLSSAVIARISRQGQSTAADREIAVARWLERVGIPAVRVAEVGDQPIDVDGRAVTFWQELPPHTPGTAPQVAQALRRLHDAAPPPDLNLGRIEPFVRLPERIDNATTLSNEDRSWLRDRLTRLRRQWEQRPVGLPDCVVHGDAWRGNVVATEQGHVIFLDLERTSMGPPEWDLVHTAIKHSSFGWISSGENDSFISAYGHDVTQWDGFKLLRDIREFRMTCMAAQVSSENPQAEDQARHRLACLQGKHGQRPWSGWAPLPSSQ
jgi:aminoglycoside phosphotransferase (APT) family kinase protein